MVKELILMLTLNDDKAKSIVEYLFEEGKAHLRKIARDLNMNVEKVRYHITRLERAGVVKSYEDGNKIVYSINPDFIPSLSNLL